MRVMFRGMAVLAVVVASALPGAAHHSNPLYFDMSKAITLEGTILRVAWINPHVLLYLQTTSGKGDMETWVLHGRSLNNAMRELGPTRERLTPGTPISARAWPPRNALRVDDAETVLLARPDDARRSSRIAGAGQIKFANGDVMAFGGGPAF